MWSTFYSKALRCTFLGIGKTCVAQKLCNLSYLIRQRHEHKKTCSLWFSLHTFVHLNFLLDSIQKRALSWSVQTEALFLETLLYLTTQGSHTKGAFRKDFTPLWWVRGVHSALSTFCSFSPFGSGLYIAVISARSRFCLLLWLPATERIFYIRVATILKLSAEPEH